MRKRAICGVFGTKQPFSCSLALGVGFRMETAPLPAKLPLACAASGDLGEPSLCANGGLAGASARFRERIARGGGAGCEMRGVSGSFKVAGLEWRLVFPGTCAARAFEPRRAPLFEVFAGRPVRCPFVNNLGLGLSLSPQIGLTLRQSDSRHLKEAFS